MGKNNTHYNITAIIKDKKGNVLSIGKNSYYKTHPAMLLYARKIGRFNSMEWYLHAEVEAIIKCSDLDEAHSIEVYGRAPGGSYCLAKPCKICMSAIKSTNIKKIYYTTKSKQLELIEL
jgi:deoxycytidylate deaminase